MSAIFTTAWSDVINVIAVIAVQRIAVFCLRKEAASQTSFACRKTSCRSATSLSTSGPLCRLRLNMHETSPRRQQQLLAHDAPEAKCRLRSFVVNHSVDAIWASRILPSVWRSRDSRSLTAEIDVSFEQIHRFSVTQSGYWPLSTFIITASSDRINVTVSSVYIQIDWPVQNLTSLFVKVIVYS